MIMYLLDQGWKQSWCQPGYIQQEKHLGMFHQLWIIHRLSPVSCACAMRSLLQAGEKEADRNTGPDAGLAGGMCWFWLSDGSLDRNQSDSQSKHAYTHTHINTHLLVQAHTTRDLPQAREAGNMPAEEDSFPPARGNLGCLYHVAFTCAKFYSFSSRQEKLCERWKGSGDVVAG